jgi:hypothetical protein
MAVGKILLAGALAFGLLLVGVGWLVAQSAALVATGVRAGIDVVRPYVEEGLPVGISREALEQRLDAAAEAARNGRIDLEAARDTLRWLPGALLDGQLDAAETAALGAKLERIVRLSPPVGGAPPPIGGSPEAT